MTDIEQKQHIVVGGLSPQPLYGQKTGKKQAGVLV